MVMCKKLYTLDTRIALKVVHKEIESKFGIRRILRRKRELWECKGRFWWIGKVGVRDKKWSKGATSVQLAILLDVRCIKDGKYQQAIGVAIEYQRLDKVVEAIVRSDSVDATLAYYTSHFLKKLSFLLNFIAMSEEEMKLILAQEAAKVLILEKKIKKFKSCQFRVMCFALRVMLEWACKRHEQQVDDSTSSKGMPLTKSSNNIKNIGPRTTSHSAPSSTGVEATNIPPPTVSSSPFPIP
ncbi:hypothetical protein CQW23_02248 [Capsicum baccatum]|uniref:26S proteasome non-ATPase regulatory subunit 1/RPN2 N-terminal domain-containing protein n=1 Tax=Capsicum baccatum TaxID=33114 RepID=A0A2G2XQW1_CAPBA|nr:hypothetical protein CQW23_02248 [Capsicum baccatum]